MTQLSSISVIVPVFNEAQSIAQVLTTLTPLLRQQDELIVVDGESIDGTFEVVQETINLLEPVCKAQVIRSRKGRAFQMNSGARQAEGDLLVFLHADTLMTKKAWVELLLCLETSRPGVRFWGRFDVRIQGKSKWLPVVSWFMNWRSRLTHIATGDQCIFVTRPLFNRIGGYFDQPLMEDIELCKTLKTQPDVLFLALDGPLVTSGRRWDQHGAWQTILLMWRFRYQYWRGANAYDLARQYRDVRGRLNQTDSRDG